MLANRPTRRIVLAGLTWLALACGPSVLAQSATSGEDPFAVGATDGRRLGLSQGRVLGRAQALYEAFRDGFRQGLSEAREPGSVRTVADRARLQGRTRGAERGAVAGREAGAESALRAWLAKGARALQPMKPGVKFPSDTLASPACPKSSPLELPLGAEIQAEVDPDGLEERESPVVVDSFDLAYPREDDLRNRARAAGATAHAVDFWVRDYKDAFQSAWHQSFQNERSGTSLEAQGQLNRLGLQVGRAEGERRLSCAEGPRFWQDGFRDGWAESWADAFEVAWAKTDARHRKRAVVVVLEPRLVDASGDGLLEPGEGLRLEATIVNAGAVEARRSAGSWGALRGLEAEGHLEGGLAPGQSRDLRLELGTVDPQAPTGTSVVVRIRGLGSEPTTLSERLGRPARIDDAETSLAIEDGRLVARIDARILSTSPASSRAELELAGRGGATEVGKLAGGESKRVRLVLPASLPKQVGDQTTGVFVLRTTEGQPWHAGRWAAPLGLAEATALATTGNAPAEVAARLVDHLTAEWDGAVAADPKGPLPDGWLAYASALGGLPKKARQRLEQQVSAPLLEHVAGSSGSKRLRKRARDLLAG